jgi:fermentation-respiration switch protein FrsA (DUF1100 family)
VQLLTVFGSREGLRRASPVAYVTSDDPPFLIVHGEMDTVVLPSQSQELYSKLNAARVPATLVMVWNAGHGLRPIGGAISPSRGEITKMMADFFDRYLQDGEAVASTQISSLTIDAKPFSIRPWMVIMVAVVGAGVSAISILIFLLKRTRRVSVH